MQKLTTFKETLLFILAIFLLSPSSSAEIARAKDGAVVENTTHKHSQVNPEAGDFLWELEGKPAPRYALPAGEKIVPIPQITHDAHQAPNGTKENEDRNNS